MAGTQLQGSPPAAGGAVPPPAAGGGGGGGPCSSRTASPIEFPFFPTGPAAPSSPPAESAQGEPPRGGSDGLPPAGIPFSQLLQAATTNGISGPSEAQPGASHDWVEPRHGSEANQALPSTALGLYLLPCGWLPKAATTGGGSPPRCAHVQERAGAQITEAAARELHCFLAPSRSSTGETRLGSSQVEQSRLNGQGVKAPVARPEPPAEQALRPGMPTDSLRHVVIDSERRSRQAGGKRLRSALQPRATAEAGPRLETLSLLPGEPFLGVSQAASAPFQGAVALHHPTADAASQRLVQVAPAHERSWPATARSHRLQPRSPASASGIKRLQQQEKENQYPTRAAGPSALRALPQKGNPATTMGRAKHFFGSGHVDTLSRQHCGKRPLAYANGQVFSSQSCQEAQCQVSCPSSHLHFPLVVSQASNKEEPPLLSTTGHCATPRRPTARRVSPPLQSALLAGLSNKAATEIEVRSAGNAMHLENPTPHGLQPSMPRLGSHRGRACNSEPPNEGLQAAGLCQQMLVANPLCEANAVRVPAAVAHPPWQQYAILLAPVQSICAASRAPESTQATLAAAAGNLWEWQHTAAMPPKHALSAHPGAVATNVTSSQAAGSVRTGRSPFSPPEGAEPAGRPNHQSAWRAWSPRAQTTAAAEDPDPNARHAVVASRVASSMPAPNSQLLAASSRIDFSEESGVFCQQPSLPKIATPVPCGRFPFEIRYEQLQAFLCGLEESKRWEQKQLAALHKLSEGDRAQLVACQEKRALHLAIYEGRELKRACLAGFGASWPAPAPYATGLPVHLTPS